MSIYINRTTEFVVHSIQYTYPLNACLQFVFNAYLFNTPLAIQHASTVQRIDDACFEYKNVLQKSF